MQPFPSLCIANTDDWFIENAAWGRRFFGVFFVINRFLISIRWIFVTNIKKARLLFSVKSLQVYLTPSRDNSLRI